MAGVNGPVIFSERDKKSHPRFSGDNTVKTYGLPEGFCILEKKAYMDGDILEMMVDVVAPGIRKTEVRQKFVLNF